MFYSFILPCWCKCLKWLLAAASNISHFLIGISLLTHYTLNSATEKWITLILSVACTSSHHTQRGLFPMNVAVFMVAGLLCVQKQASKINLALAFLPLVMLGVPLHFISIFFLLHIFFWLTHTLKFGSSWTSYIFSKHTFSSEKQFCKKALPDSAGLLPAHIQSVICWHQWQKKVFTEFYFHKLCGFHTVKTEKRSALPQGSPLSHHYWN